MAVSRTRRWSSARFVLAFLATGLLVLPPSGCTGVLGTPLASGDASPAGDTATTGDQAVGGDTTPSGDDAPVGGDPPPLPTGTLSDQYPDDAWDLSDPAILFATDFEDATFGGLSTSSYTGDPFEVVNDAGEANNGSHSMKFSFTLTSLASRGDASISASTVFTLPANRAYYVRYYMRYPTGTARPHHANGTRVYAPGFDVGGTAGIRPNGDERFNTTIDIDDQGRHFFYTYWHEMRSSNCNDGTTVPGCPGDQGHSLYYGNNLKPPNQAVVDRYQWRCYEYRLQANTPNQYDGEVALWIDDARVGEFRTGVPMGEWLRSNFYTMSEWGTEPTTPFEGFNFRTDAAVDQVRVKFMLYQEQGTLTNSRDDTPVKTEEQAAFYDDIVVASERIGCRVGP